MCKKALKVPAPKPNKNEKKPGKMIKATTEFGVKQHNNAMNTKIGKKMIEHQQNQSNKATQIAVESGRIEKLMKNPHFKKMMQKDLALQRKMMDCSPKYKLVNEAFIN